MCDRRTPEQKALAQQAAEQEEKNRAAFYAVQPVAENYLKAPGSAKWPWSRDVAFKTLDSNSIEVRTFVDSQNSFGALLRTQVLAEVSVEKKDGEYIGRVTSLVINGEKVR